MGHTLATHHPSHHPSLGFARRPRRRLVAAVAAGALVLAACGGDDDDAATSTADAAAETGDADAGAGDPATPYGLVDAATAAELADDPDITVLDVRTPEEYAEGHIEGATLIDFYSDTFAEQLAELDADQQYLVYCRSGNRSGQAVAQMHDLGIDNVYDLDGGVGAWAGAGLALVR